MTVETTSRPLSETMRRLFIGSLADTAARPVQRGFDAVNQDGSSKRLGQKANGSDLQRAGTDALIGKGRDKNKRYAVSPGAHMSQEVQAAHTWHLHIRNDT